MRSVKQIMRGVFSVRSHLIMRLNTEFTKGLDKDSAELTLYKVERSTELIDGTYTIATQEKIKSHNEGLCDTFLLKSNDNPIGILSVMYKNGDELEYRIRNIDAFIFNVFINEELRGNGYCGKMIQLLVSRLKMEKSISEVYLAVSEDNLAAINAYHKIGFISVYKKRFFRVLRHNIPYPQIAITS